MLQRVAQLRPHVVRVHILRREDRLDLSDILVDFLQVFFRQVERVLRPDFRQFQKAQEEELHTGLAAFCAVRFGLCPKDYEFHTVG